MEDYTMFKQALRGFDKDEVLAYIRNQEVASSKRIAALEKDVRKRDRIISELKNRIVMKDEQVDRLEQDIRDKYQRYIDNYRQIGDLVYEARVKGEKIVSDAQAEADRILTEAETEAKRRVDSVQGEIDAKLVDGKQKYLAVQDEMNEIVDLFNQMQRKFMVSYKEVHEIIQSMPASLDEIDLEGDVLGDDLMEDDIALSSFGLDLDDEDFEDSNEEELSVDSEEGGFEDDAMRELKETFAEAASEAGATDELPGAEALAKAGEDDSFFEEEADEDDFDPEALDAELEAAKKRRESSVPAGDEAELRGAIDAAAVVAALAEKAFSDQS